MLPHADPVAVLAVVCLYPSNFTCLLSSLCFIGVGALDMWRRRALMRSCAAMLSVQREFRRHCPAEARLKAQGPIVPIGPRP